MQIIKLNATDSTNDYLKGLVSKGVQGDYTVVVARKQRKGKGQLGNVWNSESGKNLTCSVLKHLDGFATADAFLLNCIVSLAVSQALQDLKVPDVHVKWPNDILSGRLKVCGILIENFFVGTMVRASVIGIGLNINQTDFDQLPKASSLKLILGQNFDVDEVLFTILQQLKVFFERLENGHSQEIKALYEKNLFRKDKPSTFSGINGTRFSGFIRGVSAEGRIIIELEDRDVKEFGLKEVQLLY